MSIDKNYTPKLYKSTANMTVSEWENERRNSIGGSDMSVLLGLNPYNITKRELYYEKIGKKPVNVSKDYGQEIIFNSGHFLEEAVANIFSYRTGYETYEIKAMFEHPRYPFIRGNIDRFYRYKGTKEPLSFLECKTTTEYNKEWNDNKIPKQYVVQIATYMSILNFDFCKISCLFIPEIVRQIAGILFQLKNVFGSLPDETLSDIKDQLNSIEDEEAKLYVPTIMKALGGEFLIPKHLLETTSDALDNKTVIRELERDETLEELILESASDFWHNYVEKRVEPPLDNEDGEAAIKTLDAYTKKVSSPVPIRLPYSLYDNFEEINQLKKQRAEYTRKSKEIDNRIAQLSVPVIEALHGLDSAEIEDDIGEIHTVTYKPSKNISVPKSKIELLRNSYPDAYKDVAVETEYAPTLKIK